MGNQKKNSRRMEQTPKTRKTKTFLLTNRHRPHNRLPHLTIPTKHPHSISCNLLFITSPRSSACGPHLLPNHATKIRRTGRAEARIRSQLRVITTPVVHISYNARDLLLSAGREECVLGDIVDEDFGRRDGFSCSCCKRRIRSGEEGHGYVAAGSY